MHNNVAILSHRYLFSSPSIKEAQDKYKPDFSHIGITKLFSGKNMDGKAMYNVIKLRVKE